MNNKFTKLKNELITSKLKDLDFRVMCYLLARSKKGQCFPSISRIAKDLNKSIETIRTSLERLINEEYIKKENRFLGTGKKTSNLYIINEKYLAKKTKQEIFEQIQVGTIKKEMFDYDWLNEEEYYEI